MSDWIEYRVWCVTESAWVTWILPETAAEPTTCSNDSTHTINPESVAEWNRRSETETKLNELEVPPGVERPTGKFRGTTSMMVAQPLTTTIKTIEWPFGVGVLSLRYTSSKEHEGDMVNVYVARNTVVGFLTADVVANDTVLHVNATVMANVSAGLLVNLYDGPQQEDLGQIVSINHANGTITVERAATLNFSALGPTQVRITVQNVEDYIFGPASTLTLGDNKIGASFIPAGNQVEVHYTNRSPPLRVGTVTQDVVVSDTVIHVDEATLQTLCFGDQVDLWDGTNQEALGSVTEVNTMTQTISVDTASTQAFLAATPTYVLKSAKRLVVEIQMLY